MSCQENGEIIVEVGGHMCLTFQNNGIICPKAQPRPRVKLELLSFWQKCPKSHRRKSPETEEQKLYILRWEEST